MPYLLLLFIAMPIVEIALLIRVGGTIGVLPTLAIVVLTAVLGTALLRQQGLATLARARAQLDAGELPARQLVEGLLLVFGGALLLTPGFVTDAFGFACLLPPTRRWLAERLSARAVGVVVGGRVGGAGRADRVPGDGPGASGDPGQGGDPSGSRRRAPGTVIEGDYRRVD